MGLETCRAEFRISQNRSHYGGISVSVSSLWDSDECERIWNRLDSSYQYFCLCRKSSVSGGYNACSSGVPRYGACDVPDAQCPPPVLWDFHAGKYGGLKRFRAYLIFSLTDETFSVVCSEQIPSELDGNGFISEFSFS